MSEEDRCGSGEDDHEVLVKIEFDVNEEDDHVHVGLATINSHVHNVPVEVAAQSLLVTAHKMLSDSMAHTTFEHVDDHRVAHAMADAAAATMLAEIAKQIPEKAVLMPVIVPDDISSLIEGE